MKRTATTERGRALLALFDRLTWYKVLNWSSSSSDKDTDRKRVADIERADVVASMWPGNPDDKPLHTVVLDIDHPAWLLNSSTEGHHHLYVDVPRGVPHDKYMNLLTALAEAGVIEHGFANASIERGFSCARLPWIKKPEKGANG